MGQIKEVSDAEARSFMRRTVENQRIQDYVKAQILKTIEFPKDLSGTIEKQQRFVAELHLAQRPCPFCDQPCSYFEAISGDGYKLGYGHERLLCPETDCCKEIVEIVPFISDLGWRWGKKHTQPKKTTVSQ